MDEPARLFLRRYQGCQRQRGELVVSDLRVDHLAPSWHRSAGVSRQHREGNLARRAGFIWLQNPYSTYIVHTATAMAQLYEVLNNWRLIHLGGRALPTNAEPWVHGNSQARWKGDTLVIESISCDERTDITDSGWFHSGELRVTERYSRPSMNHLIVEITVDDPKVLTKPWWRSARRRWTLGNGEVYEFYCTNNKEVEELEKLREVERTGK